MAAEGQLGAGATLSMEEVMQRLVDAAQFDLQAGGGGGVCVGGWVGVCVWGGGGGRRWGARAVGAAEATSRWCWTTMASQKRQPGG